MTGIPSQLYDRCRTTLVKCREFGSDDALSSMFVTDELPPFRAGLPGASSTSGRVDACLAFLVDRSLSDSRSVLPLFLLTLRDRYQQGDALRDELEALAKDVETVFAAAPSTPTGLANRLQREPEIGEDESFQDSSPSIHQSAHGTQGHTPLPPAVAEPAVNEPPSPIPGRAWLLLGLVVLDLLLLLALGWCLVRNQPTLISYFRFVVNLVAVCLTILTSVFVKRRPIELEGVLHRLGTERRWLVAVSIITTLSLVITCIFWPLRWVGNCGPTPASMQSPTLPPAPTNTSTASTVETPAPSSTTEKVVPMPQPTTGVAERATVPVATETSASTSNQVPGDTRPVLFQDDFESQAMPGKLSPGVWRQWDLRVIGGAEWELREVEPGNYALCVSTRSNDYAYAVAGSPTWRDYVIEADVKVIDFSSEGEVSMQVRDQETAYELQLGREGTVLSRQHGVWLAATEESLAPNRWHTVHFEASGPHLRVSLDQNPEPILSARDDQLGQGRFRLGATTGGEACFDNVRVFATEAPDPVSSASQGIVEDMHYCLKEHFDLDACSCAEPQTRFMGLVDRVYVRWTLANPGQQVEMSRNWFLDGQEVFTRTVVVGGSLLPEHVPDCTWLHAPGLEALGLPSHLPAGSYSLHMSVDRVEQAETGFTVEPLQILFSTDREGDLDVYLMEMDGGNPRAVLETSQDQIACDWSPTRHEMLYVEGPPGERDLYRAELLGQTIQHLEAIDYPSRNVADAAWSPDGQTIAFVTNVRKPPLYDIMRYDVRTGAKVQIPVVFTAYLLTGNSTWSSSPVTIKSRADMGPAWSPDGSQIVFSLLREDDAGHWGLYQMNTSGGELRELWTTSGYASEMPAWSPDGDSLAFLRSVPGSGAGEIRVLDLNKRQTRRISEPGMPCRSPAWSPDGRWIAYDCIDEVGRHIYLFNTNTDQQAAITKEAWNDRDPIWVWTAP